MLQTDHLFFSPESEIIRFLQHANGTGTNSNNLENIRDKYGNLPFRSIQREDYYHAILPQLDDLDGQTELSKKYESPLYRRKRTQASVNFKWSQEVRPIKCCTLFLWLFFATLSGYRCWPLDACERCGCIHEEEGRRVLQEVRGLCDGTEKQARLLTSATVETFPELPIWTYFGSWNRYLMPDGLSK